MVNEIIELLPSADLRAKIKETNHQFKESELLEIIYKNLFFTSILPLSAFIQFQ